VTRAARRYSAEAMLFAGLALLALDLVFLRFTPPSLRLLFVALVVWAFATDLLWPSQQRRIVELVPQWRGIALALTASFVFCGIGVGSAVAGWVYPAFGLTGSIGSSLAFLALATGSLLVSRASVNAKRSADVARAPIASIMKSRRSHADLRVAWRAATMRAGIAAVAGPVHRTAGPAFRSGRQLLFPSIAETLTRHLRLLDRRATDDNPMTVATA
jgi:MFS family permease